jgi:hypothetical protein
MSSTNFVVVTEHSHSRVDSQRARLQTQAQALTLVVMLRRLEEQDSLELGRTKLGSVTRSIMHQNPQPLLQATSTTADKVLLAQTRAKSQ